MSRGTRRLRTIPTTTSDFHDIEVLVFLILLALVFDFMNGFHDAANSMRLSYQRVCSAAVGGRLGGFFQFHGTFHFSDEGCDHHRQRHQSTPSIVDHLWYSARWSALSAWNFITWLYGIGRVPRTAIDRGLVGAAVAKSGTGSLVASGLIKPIAFISAVFAVGFFCSGATADARRVMGNCVRTSPHG